MEEEREERREKRKEEEREEEGGEEEGGERREKMGERKLAHLSLRHWVLLGASRPHLPIILFLLPDTLLQLFNLIFPLLQPGQTVLQYTNISTQHPLH